MEISEVHEAHEPGTPQQLALYFAGKGQETNEDAMSAFTHDD